MEVIRVPCTLIQPFHKELLGNFHVSGTENMGEKIKVRFLPSCS